MKNLDIRRFGLIIPQDPLCVENAGWMMYLRYEGDTGFSSRNLDEASAEEIEFVLDNGQEDLYPKNWMYPLSVLKEAMLSFINNGELPSQIKWHEDSK